MFNAMHPFGHWHSVNGGILKGLFLPLMSSFSLVSALRKRSLWRTATFFLYHHLFLSIVSIQGI